MPAATDCRAESISQQFNHPEHLNHAETCA
jgi:hypothetical protein